MSEIRKALVITCLFLVAACTANAEERSVGPFSKLHVQNGIDIYLTQSDRESLRVEASDPDNVVTDVANGELRISRKRAGGFFGGGGKVYVGFVRLSDVDVSGGSDIESQNQLKLDDFTLRASGGSDVDLDVQAKSLDLSLSGGCDARLKGSAETLAVRASGGSDISAGGLNAGRVKLNVSGGSDARVNASDAIEIDASGGSDVSVTGNPRQRTVNNDKSSDVYWR